MRGREANPYLFSKFLESECRLSIISLSLISSATSSLPEGRKLVYYPYHEERNHKTDHQGLPCHGVANPETALAAGASGYGQDHYPCGSEA